MLAKQLLETLFTLVSSTALNVTWEMLLAVPIITSLEQLFKLLVAACCVLETAPKFVEVEVD